MARRPQLQPSVPARRKEVTSFFRDGGGETFASEVARERNALSEANMHT